MVSSRSGRWFGLFVVTCAAFGLASCGNRDPEGGGGASTTRVSAVRATLVDATPALSGFRARPGSPLGTGIATGFDPVAEGLKPRFSESELAATPTPARVTLPANAAAAVHLEDAASNTAVDVFLRAASPVAAQSADGYLVFPAALSPTATLLHRAIPEGTEDFIAFDVKPTATEVAYDLALGADTGLRLVSGTLEILDSAGAPRLRVAPPYIVGADGTLTDATLSVAGCAVDTDPAAPWARALTPPGASTCEIKVAWPDSGVVYPAVLDPRWTTTGSMVTARYEHTLTLIASTGKVLAAGGRSSTGSTTGLNTAELYDKDTGTWATTASFTSGRRLHSAIQLNTSGNPATSGKVLIAGGISGSTSLNTFQLYSPSAGTWSSAANMNAARHAHTATLLADGRVLVAGGLNGTTTLQTAALYNPASGSGSWAATTGPIPPPGLKNQTATLIQTSNQQLNNKVLLVGGNSGSSTISAVYLFDPAQSAFSTLASIPSPREQHAAVVLPNSNGKILVVGGKNGSTVLSSAIRFDPGSGPGSWQSAGTMTSARFGHTATALPTSVVANGSVLVAGGSSASATLSSAELFSDTSTWTATPSMPGPTQNHGAVLLGSNIVLVAGGRSNSTTVLSAARLYDAAFGLGCSSASQCPSGFCVDGVCCDSACGGGCGACNLAGFLGTCSLKPSGTTCRTVAGACDVAETCDGASFTCPSDTFLPSSTVCRASTGQCDVPENCSGVSATCPVDAKKPDGTICDDGDACTQTETCQSGACTPPTGVPTIVNLPADDLGTIGGDTAASDINASGQVAGASVFALSPHAFSWTRSSALVDVGGMAGFSRENVATAINDAGMIAGALSEADGNHAFRYSVATGLQDIGRAGDGSTVNEGSIWRGAYPQSINAGRQVSGYLTDAGQLHGFRYTDGVGFEDIGSLGGTRTVASGIDPTGLVVGASRLPDSPATGYASRGHAVSFDDALLLVDLNSSVDPLLGWTLIEATDIAGDFVVGGGERAGMIRPFRLRRSDNAVDEISGSWEGESYATGVNTFGDLVGWGYLDAAGTQQAAFAYSDRIGFKKLNDLIDPSSGWDLKVATAINDSDEIVGWGLHNGQKRAFFLSLAPQKLACGDLNACGGGSSAPICLWVDGVVDVGGGQFVAVFGYQSAEPSTVHPSPNQKLLDGAVVTDPQPAPPSWLSPGVHPGAFAPTFEGGHTVAWRVNAETISATAGLRQLTKIPIGTGGFGVEIGGNFIVIRPDLDKYAVAPPAPGTAAEPPVGDEFTGALTGTFSVSPSGAATYTVPISIPPGVAGMAPSLSLVYSSQGRNGLAGQGFELTGLSAVHRCPKTRVQDGKARPVMMDGLGSGDDKDGICLDGKRLFEKTGTSPPEYYTDIADFTVITRSTDFKTFKVVTKTGETRFYASRDDARVVFDGQTAIWALDRVQDQWGNFFDLFYHPDFADNGLRIKQIKYTGHVTPSGTQDVDPFYAVDFFYEPRPDIRTTTRFRKATMQSKTRLAAIQTARGAYSLTYMPSALGLPSRLQKIDYTAPVQPIPPPPAVPTVKALKPLEFSWNSSATSFWSSASANTGYALPAEIPVGKGLKGTQFIDLDADGRQDLVVARAKATTLERLSYRNNGHGWDGTVFPPLPADLIDVNDVGTGLRFADMDADGRPDLIMDNADVRCTSPTSCMVCSSQQTGCSTGPAHHASPAVWINRLDDLHEWVYDASFEQRPTSGDFDGNILFYPKNPSTPDYVADVDGDGRADVVRTFSTVGQGGSFLSVTTLLNTTAGWRLFSRLDLPGGSGFSNNPFHFQDVNRDGLPDLTKSDFFVYDDGHLEADEGVYINQGPTKNANGDIVNMSFAPETGHSHTPGGGATPLPLTHTPATGDIDGDGMHDFMAYFPTHDSDTGNIDREEYRAGIALADGTGLGFDDPNAANYLATVAAFSPKELPGEPIFLPDDYGWALIDANGDGLADLLRNHAERFDGPNEHRGGGQLLINNGTNWIDRAGTTEWQVPVPGDPVPVVPDPQILKNDATFVDVNGDGLVDLVHAAVGGNPSKTYLNTYAPPVITNFPKQLSTSPTFVSYVPITTEAARSGAKPTYTDSGNLGLGLVYSSIPIRVVSQTSEFNGVSGTTTIYQYADMRASSFQYGSQGFERTIVTDQTSGTVTETHYAQAYPYTGMPTGVSRSNQGPVNSTTTTYCTRNPDREHPDTCFQFPHLPQAYPPKSSFFVRPIEVVDRSYLRTTFPEPSPAAQIETTTEFDFDDFGNPTVTTVKTVGPIESYRKETRSKFGEPNSLEQRNGKMTESVVTTTKTAGLVGPPITHRTEMTYATFFGALALARTKTEPGVPDAEVHKVYAYDRFGNVTATTDCASDFDSCSTEAPDSLPFRTTRTSYDPAELSVPVSYGVGRFPTKVTNAIGHSETTVFEPLLGLVTEQTGPNGIKNCYAYDPFGVQISETKRCGSDHPVTTTTTRYRPKVPPPPGPCGEDFCPLPPNFTQVITVARPAGGSPTWTYGDALGRPIAVVTLGFGADIIQTRTEYDAQGRVHRTSKPFGSADQPRWTTTDHDPIGRPLTITQDLGQIGDPITGAGSVSTIVSMTYLGFTTRTEQTVNGELRRKEETKNTLGKTALIKTFKGDPNDPLNAVAISYLYDVEGNLTDTIDPVGNTAHVVYDLRARKTSMTDPDLGFWEYQFNGFGDLLTQIDPNGRAAGQVTSMTYDKLARMTSKTNGQGTSEFIFDVAPGAGVGKLAATIGPVDTHLAGACLHPITNENLGKRPVRSFRYTTLGDVETTSECTDGDIFTTSTDYDDLGRPRRFTYPEVRGNRFAVDYHYTSLGYLHYITDAADGAVYWATTAVNAAGQVTAEYTRNGVDTISQYEPATGWLLARASAAYGDASKMIQAWAYRFDEAGNLRRRLRMDEVADNSSDETFGYDRLDRLIVANTVSPTPYSETYAYDDIGNIRQKAGKTFTYDAACAAGARAAGPHAICGATGGITYAYDGNGNMTSGADRTITYNPSNKVTHILSEPLGSGPSTADFIYDADGQRVVQETAAGGVTARTIYVGLGKTGKSLYERTKRDASTFEHVHYLYAQGSHGGNAFAIRTVTDDGSQTPPPATKYFHFDHLGSIVGVSDELGHVVDPQTGGRNPGVLSYDGWGARRASETQAANPASFDPAPGRREFTGHETIPGVGLVNMNGRVYDPAIGRFLSPDPNVQFVANLQSYNRYSYALNNPLRYTDPTGFFLGIDFSSSFFWFQFVGTLVVCAGGPYACAAWVGALVVTNAIVAIANGADPALTITLSVMSFGIGFVTGGAIGAAGGSNLMTAIISGAVSGAVTTAFTNLATGQGLGWNILLNAGMGAVGAAAGYGLQRYTAISQAAESARYSEGSGAQLIERVEVEQAMTGKAASNGDNGSYAGDAERGRAAGLGSAPAAKGAGQRLSAIEDTSLRRDPSSGSGDRYRRVIQWKLAQPSPKGGYIIQHVSTSVDGTLDYELYEAWRVNPGKNVTTYAEKGLDLADDTFQFHAEPLDVGTIRTIDARANFYEDYTLPPAFVKGGATEARGLPSTTDMSIQLPTPKVPGVTRHEVINW